MHIFVSTKENDMINTGRDTHYQILCPQCDQGKMPTYKKGLDEVNTNVFGQLQWKRGTLVFMVCMINV